MKVVYKYKVDVVNNQVIELPKEAEILCVQTQNDAPQLWVLIDTEEMEKEQRFFDLYGTGHLFKMNKNEIYNHIGTFQLNDGMFVGHLFEVKKK